MLAIFFSLSIFLVLPSAFGGEWHSAGNAPAIPHRPAAPAHYKCILTAYTSAAKKEYRVDIEKEFRDEDFREPNGAAVALTMERQEDPGMNGQSMRLGFFAGENGNEMLVLSVHATVAAKASSFSRHTVSRETGMIEGSANLYIEKAGRKAVRSVRVEARCVAI